MTDKLFQLCPIKNALTAWGTCEWRSNKTSKERFTTVNVGQESYSSTQELGALWLLLIAIMLGQAIALSGPKK